MKKNKLFQLISILILLTLFGTAAICNQCAITSTTETTASSTTASATEITSSETSAEITTNTTSQSEAPTIKLAIYEGPTYSAADDICYYKIQATVTGNPAPKVTFSKDDSNGTWGSKKAQINIHRLQPYKLTATAANSVGSASDSISLSWGCGSENRNPDISDMVIPGGNLITNQQYDISASASDLDGDSLTYIWTVSGGSINNAAANPMKWTTPGAAGDYTIKIKVTDGKGGEDTKTITVNVQQSSINLTLHQITSEGGYIEQGGIVNAGGCLFIGDSNNNKPVRGFISYDITGLTGATIQNATLTFNLKKKWGDPSAFGALSLCSTYWGANPLVQAAFMSPCKIGIQQSLNVGDGNLTCNAAGLTTALQDAIDSGWARFQVTIWFGVLTNGNNTWDGWDYDQNGININITYTH